MLRSEPAGASKEWSPIRPGSQLSSTNRRIDLWSVSVWSSESAWRSARSRGGIAAARCRGGPGSERARRAMRKLASAPVDFGRFAGEWRQANRFRIFESSAICGRSFGSGSRQLSMAEARGSGKRQYVRTDFARPVSCPESPFVPAAGNALRPVAASKSTTPIPQTSVAGATSSPRACSGAK